MLLELVNNLSSSDLIRKTTAEKMLPLKIIFVVLFIQFTIGYASTVKAPSSLLNIIVESTLTNTNINSTVPVDFQSISSKMTNGFKEIQSVATRLLEITALPAVNAENFLTLLSVVHDVFDTIIATTRGLKHKLNGIIGVVDLPIINIQVALQTLIQTIVVDVIITDDSSVTTQNDINYSLLGVVDGIQLLLDTVHNLLSGIVTLPANDLSKSIMCLEGIVQTILSITENLLQALSNFLLKFKINTRANVIMPELLIPLTNSLNKLATELKDPVTKVVKKVLEPTLLKIISKLKNNLSSVTDSSLDLIKNISQPIDTLVATITDNYQKTAATRTLTTIPHITRSMPSTLRSLSNEVQSLNGNTIGVQSIFNVALSNAIASFHSLTAYLTIITSHGFTATHISNTAKLLSDTQIVLLLLATNLQTLIDTATQAICQSVIHSLRSKKLKGINEIQTSLKETAMKISLLLENFVKVDLRAMQSLLTGVSQALRKVLVDYGKSLAAVATNISHSLGDLNSVIGETLGGTSNANISNNLTASLNDGVKAFRMVVDNVENLRIYVRNAFRAVERRV